MTPSMDAVLVSAVRTPVGRIRGTLRDVRPDDLAAIAIAEAVRRAPAISPDEIDDVVIGCAMPEAEQGMNVARIASLRAGLPVSTSAVTVNRFCASGLEAIAIAAERVQCGSGRVIVAGGVESMTCVPMAGHRYLPNPTLIDRYPDVYLRTGLVAENHARESGISREAQDEYALRSHRRAVTAIEHRRFADELVPVPVGGSNGRAVGSVDGDAIDAGGIPADTPAVAADEGPRADASAHALAKLRPVFHTNGTVTAGNSSQMSDGAAAVVVMRAEEAARRGLRPLGRLVAYATAGVEPERFGLGPVPAMQKVLARAGLRIGDIDLVELNEAFAAQVLACLKLFPVDPDRLNVNGGAIALGHPLGCTGARLTVSLLHELRRRRAKFGLVAMCVGGGMGAAAVVESL
jgi:acetyl-CoA acyltransferase